MASGALADAISSDVVGYAQAGLRSGFKAAGAQFNPVAGGQYDLVNLTVTGYDKEDGTDGDVSVQTLDATGNMIDQYFWVDVTDGDDVVYGWFDNNGDQVEAGTVTFAVGDGLWVDAVDNTFGLQSAGSVLSEDYAVVLRAGFKMVANSTPVAVDLTEITVTGYDADEGTDGDVSVQTLDSTGNMIDQYFWVDVTDGDDVVYGWFDNNGDQVEAENVMVEAGAALWVDAADSTFSLVIPGVDL